MGINLKAFLKGFNEGVLCIFSFGLITPKKPKIKQYSFSSDPATIGVDNKLDLLPEIKDFITGKTNKITNENFNKLIELNYPKVPKIETGYYRLNHVLVDTLCFTIFGIEPITWDDNDGIKDIRIILKEETSNISLVMNVSIEDFHEIFNHMKLPQPVTIEKE